MHFLLPSTTELLRIAIWAGVLHLSAQYNADVSA
jgi:hypothetical protein